MTEAMREAVRGALSDARFEETALRIMDADCDRIASAVIRAAVEGLPASTDYEEPFICIGGAVISRPNLLSALAGGGEA